MSETPPTLDAADNDTRSRLVRHLPRAAVGGALMGLANLVPGISGGTMLLAAGVYTDFIESVAKVTRLRFDRRALVLLLVITASAAVGILLLAGTVKDLVIHHRWIMYSIFVGLTLGGIPALWRIARPGSRALWYGAGVGFAVMVLVALAQRAGTTPTAGSGGFVPLAFAGFAGAASMILPGISGGYLLLILGQYVPILSAIERAVDAIRGAQFEAAMEPVLGVFLPVGIGLFIGIAGVSNLLRYLLREHRQPTLGVLLGLLLGVVVGLWPFQVGVVPEPGSSLKGRVVTEHNIGEFDVEDWPVATFRPSSGQIVASLGLMLVGGAGTMLVTRIGGDD